MQAWKQWINEAWDATPDMVYRWIWGSGDAALHMVKKPNGEYTANISKMDAAIRAAWKPINRRYESVPEPSVDKFMDKYRHHVKHGPLKARVLTGDVLVQRARKMGVKTANGLDLWSIKLLKRLLAAFWDHWRNCRGLWNARGGGPNEWRRASPHRCQKGKEKATP